MADTTLSRPAFYHHFADLHELVVSLLDDIETWMHQAAAPWIRGEGEPRETLKASLRGIVQACVEHGPLFRAVAEAAPLDARLEKAWSAFMRRWDDVVEASIRAQQAKGLIPPLDARRIANALNALDATVLIATFGRRPLGDSSAVLDTLYHIWTATLYGGEGHR